MKPIVLALFNRTSYAVQPWLDAGISCVSCDTQHGWYWGDETMASGASHYRTRYPADSGALRGMLALKGLRVALVIAFPPCNDLSVAGAKHFAAKAAENPNFQHDAAILAQCALAWGAPYHIENPVSRLSTLWRKPDLWWNPCDYAGYCPEGPHPEYPELYPEQDRYNKKTGSWVGNGFVLPPKKRLEPLEIANPGWAKLGGKSLATKNKRAATPRGWARAVYEANKHHLV